MPFTAFRRQWIKIKGKAELKLFTFCRIIESFVKIGAESFLVISVEKHSKPVSHLLQCGNGFLFVKTWPVNK